ncbi:MAG TPA: hypothetical protein VKF35_24270 [Hyphomicrobiaceae bacterium]|nr:hypothetical protein [Hyphomicrobiaceae bacterium]
MLTIVIDRERHCDQPLTLSRDLVGLGAWRGQPRIREQLVENGQRAKGDGRRIAVPFHAVEGRGLGGIIGGNGITKHDPASGPTNPHHFGKGTLGCLKMMKGKATADNVERSCGEWQAVDVPLVPFRVFQMARSCQTARLIQHGLGCVKPNASAHAAGKRNHDAPGSTGNIKNIVIWLRFSGFNQEVEGRRIVKGRRLGEEFSLPTELLGDGGCVRWRH